RLVHDLRCSGAVASVRGSGHKRFGRGQAPAMELDEEDAAVDFLGFVRAAVVTDWCTELGGGTWRDSGEQAQSTNELSDWAADFAGKIQGIWWRSPRCRSRGRDGVGT
ncbi:hypothetical protein PanWU01x14_083570, partial [Parasponia andersonii]